MRKKEEWTKYIDRRTKIAAMVITGISIALILGGAYLIIKNAILLFG